MTWIQTFKYQFVDLIKNMKKEIDKEGRNNISGFLALRMYRAYNFLNNLYLI